MEPVVREMAGRIPTAILDLIALVVVGALASGGTWLLREGQPDRVDRVPSTLREYQATCDGDTIYAAAPDYAGAGPHPIVVFQPPSYDAPRAIRDVEIPHFVSRPDDITTPDGTSPPGFPVDFLLSDELWRRVGDPRDLGPWSWIHPAPGQVQLVACAERTDVGDQVGDCDYPSPEPLSFPLHRATYEVVLYEARTREEVTRITLQGEGRYCPKLFTYYESVGATILTTVTVDQYVDAFRTFVEG